MPMRRREQVLHERRQPCRRGPRRWHEQAAEVVRQACRTLPNSGHRSSRGQRGKWASTRTVDQRAARASEDGGEKKHVALIVDQAQRDRKPRGYHGDERREGKKPDRDDQSRGGAGGHPGARQLHAAEDIAADGRRRDVAEEPADEAIEKCSGKRHAADEHAKHARQKHCVGEDDEDGREQSPRGPQGVEPGKH